MANQSKRAAILYRMVIPSHTCPFGLKAKDLLRREGFDVEDIHVTSREETDAFKVKFDVKKTPQTFVVSERIGGYDDLRRYFEKGVADLGATSYRPVIALFAMTAAMAMATAYAVSGQLSTLHATEWFIGTSMVVLALLKLQNVEKFPTVFLNYDLLAKRWIGTECLFLCLSGTTDVQVATAAQLRACA